jgi:hypothetical protein
LLLHIHISDHLHMIISWLALRRGLPINGEEGYDGYLDLGDIVKWPSKTMTSESAARSKCKNIILLELARSL